MKQSASKMPKHRIDDLVTIYLLSPLSQSNFLTANMVPNGSAWRSSAGLRRKSG